MECKTFHKGKYYITFKRGFEDSKRDVTVTIMKIFGSDSLRISLSDEDDPTFLCILNVSRCDYEDLKKQQGLLIDFDNFPSQLVRLLQQCASNNMFLIVQQTNPVQFYFEIVEHNEFRRLVHLSLKTGPATDADIKQHMADTINNLKNTLASFKSSATSSEVMWKEKCIKMEQKIHELTNNLAELKDERRKSESEFQEAMKQERERAAQERQQWQKNAEINAKAQLASSEEALNRKNRQIEELNTICQQLKDKIGHLDNQLSEKSQRLMLLEGEVQKSHIEVATLKAKNASLDREITEKEKQISNLNTRCTYLEKIGKDNADLVTELKNSLQIIKKEKLNLEERLALSESLANRNNEAANSTSEQLLKANQIISKQNHDIIEMKEKILCRTAIALEQEKVIEKNNKEIEELKSEINITKQNIVSLKTELDKLKEKYEINETALKDKEEMIKNNNMVIQWLHKKMEDTCEPISAVTKKSFNGAAKHSSTPHIQPNENSDLAEDMSEESINFYATSKLSTFEGSPLTKTQDNGNNIGLDPKYLRPADDKAKKTAKDCGSQKSVKGKENDKFSLPQVDYREKKSSRKNTYRATPVSAYFP
ncbi:spindle assembly abnormal protein 6 homolog [Cydia pomonella]|uniref:spindle assembly abnormal protein 6 homolog n=1 Tax=Cydia pomonella TaxID=82600 RepID=UPI002ADDECB6|nr:spindle assembly abnormal protein 6 homolog [Cydia pomonella]XP_061716059.1 spindle assembly abnormal protein 6 homolog [Cydia pomonella]